MRVLQGRRGVFVVMCVLALGIPALVCAQVSSTEQAVMDKILKLKGDIDALMMQPGSSSDKAAMDKVMEMKRDMDTFLELLPAHLQDQVRKKMAQGGDKSLAEVQGGDAHVAALPFVMTPEEIQQVEGALMRSQVLGLKKVGMALREGEMLSPQAKAQWVQVIERVTGSGMEADVPSMAKYVMHEAYAEAHAGLESLGEMVRFHREMRAKLKAEMARVEALVAGVSEENGPLSETIREKVFGMGLDGGVAEKKGMEVTDKAGARTYLDALKKQLGETNEKAEKANLDLEGALLKQEQKLKAMSDVSQQLQDVGQATVQSGH